MHPAGLPAAPAFTRLSKAIAAALAALCALTALLPGARAYLALVPGRTLPCVWNLLTSSFVTSHPVKALAEICALLALARLVEPVYGSAEFLRLVLVSAAGAGAATFAAAYVLYVASPAKDARVLYSQYCGFHGVVGALLVAARQVMEGQDLRLGGAVSLPARVS